MRSKAVQWTGSPPFKWLSAGYGQLGRGWRCLEELQSKSTCKCVEPLLCIKACGNRGSMLTDWVLGAQKEKGHMSLWPWARDILPSIDGPPAGTEVTRGGWMWGRSWGQASTWVCIHTYEQLDLEKWPGACVHDISYCLVPVWVCRTLETPSLNPDSITYIAR